MQYILTHEEFKALVSKTKEELFLSIDCQGHDRKFYKK